MLWVLFTLYLKINGVFLDLNHFYLGKNIIFKV